MGHANRRRELLLCFILFQVEVVACVRLTCTIIDRIVQIV